MSSAAPPDPGPDELEVLYRGTAARDPGRPSAQVREAILARARAAAAGQHAPRAPRTGPRAFPRPGWARIAAGISVVGLTTLLWLHAGGRREADAPLPATRSTARQAPAPPFTQAGTPAATLAASTRTPEPRPSAPAPRAARARAPADAALERATAAAPVQVAKTNDARVGEVESVGAAAPGGAAPARLEAHGATGRATQAVVGDHATPPDPVTVLLQAARAGDVVGVAAARRQGASLEATDGDGRTALILATEYGHAALVQSLLAGGANPNARDGTGITPLAYARRHGLAQIARDLEAAGGVE